MSSGGPIATALAGIAGGGGLAALWNYIGDVQTRRKSRGEADRDEQLLPMDIVHNASAIANENMTSMAIELTRIRAQLTAADEENARLRAALMKAQNDLDVALRAARHDLERAYTHLREMWQQLSALNPAIPRPAWLDE